MNLPPLPLTKGALLIDNSFLELLQTCDRALQHNRIDKKVLKSDNAALNFGSAIHLALEWRYQHCQNAAPTLFDEEKQIEVMQDFFVEHPPAEDDHRNLSHATTLIKRYNQRHHLEPFNVLRYKEPVDCQRCFGIGKITKIANETADTSVCKHCCGTGKLSIMTELAFAVPLFTAGEIPVIFVGKIDLPVSWDSRIIILDHKTDGMFFGPSRVLEEQSTSNQFRGYCWAFEQATGIAPDGFCPNLLPSKVPPMKPKNGIDAWWEEHLARDITYLALTPNWRNQWRNDAIAMVERFLWSYARGYFPQNGMFTKACSRYGGCQYKGVCFAPEARREHMLSDDKIYIDNLWTPLQAIKQENK